MSPTSQLGPPSVKCPCRMATAHLPEEALSMVLQVWHPAVARGQLPPCCQALGAPLSGAWLGPKTWPGTSSPALS